MDTSRIKIKIGEHEFEAEGPADIVKEQFESFKQIISSLPDITQPPKNLETRQASKNHNDIGDMPHIPLEKIMHVAGRIVSLTALPPTADDAALLIMLGHKDMRNNVSVTGQEIGDGLAQSGRAVPRVDRIMEGAIGESLVLKTGVKRATRYRLTNQGLTKALGLARDLLATIP
jgi:hypothetical protein